MLGGRKDKLKNKTTPITRLLLNASRANKIIKKYIVKVRKNSKPRRLMPLVLSKKLTIDKKNIVINKAFL